MACIKEIMHLGWYCMWDYHRNRQVFFSTNKTTTDWNDVAV